MPSDHTSSNAGNLTMYKVASIITLIAIALAALIVTAAPL